MLTHTWTHSTSVKAAEYDPDTKELIITFHGDARYKYTGVPLDEWESLITDKSPGSYVHRVIKKHPAENIT